MERSSIANRNIISIFKQSPRGIGNNALNWFPPPNKKVLVKKQKMRDNCVGLLEFMAFMFVAFVLAAKLLTFGTEKRKTLVP